MILDEAGAWLEEILPDLIERGHVPAASVAILSDGQMVGAAAGVLNNDTGVEATAAWLVQIGSITKVWTATLVMQLVDEGLLDLDAPVQTVLTDFVLGDGDAGSEITPRQLVRSTVPAGWPLPPRICWASHGRTSRAA
ncbi:serine hydrolase [Microbacterium sp. AK031]|uniref:serine hydrolase domain-containing protein n=1 Tax=Microbacterium sp. AK031 TaxID=2723076 RepID=UPI0021677E2D|nr:serine hydrolase domain-containing protein [Microbacterium sp. AK031]MCS3844996.1 CubicO group peptidase (beta-lactamase class C family) [Microbacterium sp. AK031]